MKVRFVAFALVGFALVSGCHRPVSTAAIAVPESHFSLLLEHSSSGWAARCEAGCRWNEVTMTCSGCTVRLDVAGISEVRATHIKADGFEFTVSRTSDGLAADAITGARWKSLTWNCEEGTCRARIDETGVSRG
jgi:hypothetical protein